MTSTHAFEADWYSPPGRTIQDVLHHRRINPEDFASRMGITSDDLGDLFDGVAEITADLAERLSVVLGSTSRFWLTREEQYRADVSRLTQAASDDDKAWVRALPVADMVRFGWIEHVKSLSEKIAACLQFFGVSSTRQWHGTAEVSAAFRTSPTFKSQPAAVAVWLRQGEIQAAAVNCAPWDRKRFAALLPTLRSLTRKKDPKTFIAELTGKCAECGVAVVVVRAPKGCHASGATRFLTPHKAVLMLSFRHLSEDQFWFTFFHEAGHLILHSSESLFVEWEQSHASKEESEANDFAGNTLVPVESQPAMLALPARAKAIIRFAHKVGVSPGIIVGQLQHRGRLKRDQFNRLKRWFEWTDRGEVSLSLGTS